MANKSFKYAALFLVTLAGSGAAYGQVPGAVGAIQTVPIQRDGSVTLRANADHSVRYQWFKDGEVIPKAVGDTYKVTAPGTYTVLALNDANCTSELSDPVRVVIKTLTETLADLSISKRSEIRNTRVHEPFEYLVTVTNKGPDDALDLRISDMLPPVLAIDQTTPPFQGLVQYNDQTHGLEWRIDRLAVGKTAELRFSTQALESGLVKAVATVAAASTDPNLEDNTALDQKEILDLKIPNIFTPNADGANDKFEIRGLEKYPQNKLTIMNRWGNMVYQQENYRNEWEGGSLLDGTYFYLLEVRSATGSWKSLKGYVTMVRTLQ